MKTRKEFKKAWNSTEFIIKIVCIEAIDKRMVIIYTDRYKFDYVGRVTLVDFYMDNNYVANVSLEAISFIR